MATSSRRPIATRTIAIGLLLTTVCAVLWIAFVRTDDQRRTVVRVTRPVAAGEYLTSADIEAIKLSVGSNAQEYVTTEQAGGGLVAAHDLAAGDVLRVPSVYTTGPQPPAEPTESAMAPGVETLATSTLLAIAAGVVGILCVVAWKRRRRPSPQRSQPSSTVVPSNRSPGWLHVEVNTWITEDGDWDQRAGARPQPEVASTGAGPWVARRAVTIPRDTDFNFTPSATVIEPREWHDAGSHGDNEVAADGPGAGRNTVPAPTGTPLDAPTTELTSDQPGETDAADLAAIVPTPEHKPSSTQQVSVQPAAAGNPDFGSGQPVALLQIFGDVTVHGVPISQAAATPFILAAAGRPMTTDELVELTGYAAKTFSSVYPASHPIVTRTNGMLSLAPGVWTDHAWLAETVRRAAAAVQGERDAEATDWLRQAFDLAGRIDGAPFERVPRSRREMIHGRRRDPWAWVDEFPYTVNARTNAGQEAVEAALAAAALWQAVKPTDELPSTGVVDVLCHMARLLPDVPVSRTVRPSRWQTAAPCLLLAALDAADSHDLTGRVRATAQRLVADQIIEADLALADDLGMQ
jgi:hypothetical protein